MRLMPRTLPLHAPQPKSRSQLVLWRAVASMSISRASILPLLAILDLRVACAATPDPQNSPDSLGPLSTTNATATNTADGRTASSSPTSSPTADPDSSSGPPPPATGGSTSDPATGTTGRRPNVCDGVDPAALFPPTVCDGPNDNTTTEIPANGLYATSWFGCYFEDDGSIHEDPFDNCEFACGSQGLCPAGQDGPTCEANLRWFAADADRYGCGGRIRVTNCRNGNAVVLATLDRGPNCNSVEMACDAPVLDMSHDAMVYLFDGGIFGGCDHQTVVVEPVDRETTLGPV